MSLHIEWLYCFLKLSFDLLSELNLLISGYLLLSLLPLSLPLSLLLFFLLFLFALLLEWWFAVVIAVDGSLADLCGIAVIVVLGWLVVGREGVGVVFVGIGGGVVRLEMLRMRLEVLELLHFWLFGRFVLHVWVHGLHDGVMRVIHLQGEGERVRASCWHLVGVLELLAGMQEGRVLRVVDGREVADRRQVHVGIVKLWGRLGGNWLAWLVRLFLLDWSNPLLILLFLVVGRPVCPFSLFGVLGLRLHLLLLDLLLFLLRTMADILVILFGDCLEHYLATLL